MLETAYGESGTLWGRQRSSAWMGFVLRLQPQRQRTAHQPDRDTARALRPGGRRRPRGSMAGAPGAVPRIVRLCHRDRLGPRHALERRARMGHHSIRGGAGELCSARRRVELHEVGVRGSPPRADHPAQTRPGRQNRDPETLRHDFITYLTETLRGYRNLKGQEGLPSQHAEDGSYGRPESASTSALQYMARGTPRTPEPGPSGAAGET